MTILTYTTRDAPSVRFEPCPDPFILSLLPYSIPRGAFYISTSISVTSTYVKNTNCLINTMTITQNKVHIFYCTKWDTDSNKSTDFFLNSICIMHTVYQLFITF